MSNANTETLYKIVKEMATISPEINPSKNPNKDIMEFERMNQTLSGDSRRVAYYMDLISYLPQQIPICIYDSYRLR
jgi:hypothetical protein